MHPHAFLSMAVTVLWVLSVSASPSLLGQLCQGTHSCPISGSVFVGEAVLAKLPPRHSPPAVQGARAPFLPSHSHCQTEVGHPVVLDCPPELSSISAPQRPAPSKVAQLRGGCRFGSSRFSSQSEHKFKEEIPSPTGESFSPGRSSNPTARVQVSAPL